MARPTIYTESSHLQSRDGRRMRPKPAPRRNVGAGLKPAPTLAYEATLGFGTFVDALPILDR